MKADLMLSEVARAALVLHIICEMRRDVGWLAANRQGDGEGTQGGHSIGALANDKIASDFLRFESGRGRITGREA